MLKSAILSFLFSGIATAKAQNDDLGTAFGDLNQARQLQGLEPLTWSPDLTAYAQLWANQMGSNQVPFEHASGPFRPDQGENLYVQQSGFCDSAYDNPFRNAMHAWLSQAPLYDGKPIAGHEPWLHWCKCSKQKSDIDDLKS